MANRKFWSDFKDFAMKGNVVDMAVGVVVGGAFGKIVTSIVNDIIMPCVGVLIGGFDFTSLKIVLHKAVMEGAEVVKPAVTLNYGNFIQETVNFLIIAFCIFLVIKGLAKVHKKKEEAPAAPAAPAPKPDDVVLLEEIRDLLKNHK
ncbi:MAG: large-conductance mechanosensitive channel protein MscL [Candidatus Cryptobacteroides sp.]|uniref:large-conductance mechanosensitive channel protein MscL n=1 Tax=Candidatus Cryptobacteroides bacterium TaxID=3085639 RepID=UPI00033A1268|nr:large-conductance mechanosensitive channel protein MscL [Bacteroidales bacterium]MCI6046476.1 large-conductance mechanosensitive channel protein MscL [Alistipes sp.]MDY4726312.1 large-conductance mechanosensitive channel protein MscL [Candidatus Cryptobacteroides sp.]MDY5200048.1 large-conductance mechanosensitive channel protein MscL [Candidatus Cryptobacteroides sp.]CCX52016.1 large-conductance mechanosensitive channel [Alistipes sp. CAG:514]